MNQPRVSRITIARLINTGNYEHERVEIVVDVPEGCSATEAAIGVERILKHWKPRRPVDEFYELEHTRKLKWTDEDWKRCEGAGWQDAKLLNEAKVAEEAAKVKHWRAQQGKVRELLDDLGAAYKYRDAKLDWDQEDEL